MSVANAQLGREAGSGGVAVGRDKGGAGRVGVKRKRVDGVDGCMGVQRVRRRVGGSGACGGDGEGVSGSAGGAGRERAACSGGEVLHVSM